MGQASEGPKDGDVLSSTPAGSRGIPQFLADIASESEKSMLTFWDWGCSDTSHVKLQARHLLGEGSCHEHHDVDPWLGWCDAHTMHLEAEGLRTIITRDLREGFGLLYHMIKHLGRIEGFAVVTVPFVNLCFIE
eukprot:2070672-Amphidinium_carterae.1